MIYVSLARDEINCNMNHIAGLTLYYLQKEEDLSLNYIFHFNLLFRFLLGLEFQFIQQIILTLLQFSNKQKLTDSNAKKVYRYCKYTEFFIDIAKAILDGEENLDKTKADQSYRPDRLTDFVKLKTEAAIPVSRSDTNVRKSRFLPLPEENPSFEADIDRCKTLLLSKKPRNSRRRQSQTPMDVSKEESNFSKEPLKYQHVPPLETIKIGQIEKLKNFPSLKEKWEVIEQMNKSKDLPSVNSLDDDSKKQSFSLDPIASKRSSKFMPERTKHPSQTTHLQIPAGTSRTNESKDNQTPQGRRRFQSTFTPDLKSTPENALDLKGVAASSKNTARKNSLLSERSLEVLKPPDNIGTNASNNKSHSRTQSFGSVKAYPFTLDESLEQTALTTLSSLYPLSTKAFYKSELDKESQKPCYQPTYVKENDSFSLMLAEFLHLMIKTAIETEAYSDFRERLNLSTPNYSGFWQALLEPHNGKVFELIFKVN